MSYIFYKVDILDGIIDVDFAGVAEIYIVHNLYRTTVAFTYASSAPPADWQVSCLFHTWEHIFLVNI